MSDIQRVVLEDEYDFSEIAISLDELNKTMREILEVLKSK
jgi:hypothetical protein